MSYYILPKKNNQVNISPRFEDKRSGEPCISHSLLHYLNKQKEEWIAFSEDVLKVVNNYEFLFSKVPGYKFSVSKMRPPSEKFYLLMELAHIFNLFDTFSKKDITTMHFGNCPEASIECLDMLREDNQDIHIQMNDLFHSIENTQFNNIHNIEFMYFDNEIIPEIQHLDQDFNFDNLLLAFLNILIYQSNNGISIIKINDIFHRPILDIIFLLTGAYEKIYIIKPNTSNPFKNERFLVCKFFSGKQYNNVYIDNLKKLFIQKVSGRDNLANCYLASIIDGNLPYYFLNKVEESNIIIGQQQLEAYDQANNLMKNKNKDEKIEILKKNNIQKCIQMCEKFKIPYNKFVEKVNIFLQGHNSSHENVGGREGGVIAEGDVIAEGTREGEGSRERDGQGEVERIPNIFLNPSTRFLPSVDNLIEDDYSCIDHIIKNIIDKIINDD